MLEKIHNYTDYFPAGQRIRVELPLGLESGFHEWATVNALQENRLRLQLSRDILPENAQLINGESLSIRLGNKGRGHRCKAIITRADGQGNISVKLSGPVISDELRAYYRLDAAIPLEYCREVADHGEFHPLSGVRTAKYADFDMSVSQPAAYQKPFSPLQRLAENGLSQCAPPLIINISGGGIRLESQETLPPGTLINLAFQLPLPQPELVPVVARVVYSQPQPAKRQGNLRYNIGLHYVNILERKRDSIIRYVCSEEIKKIRDCNKDYHSLSAP